MTTLAATRYHSFINTTTSVEAKYTNGEHSATQLLRVNSNVCVWRAGGVLAPHIPALSQLFVRVRVGPHEVDPFPM